MYINQKYRFSFTPPPSGTNQLNSQAIIATFYGPSDRDGFANNISIAVQEGLISRDLYLGQTLSQLVSMGFTPKGHRFVETSGREGILFEFSGNLLGRPLRYLSLALIDLERVIILTATIPENEFDKVKGEYETYLKSITFMSVAQATKETASFQ